MLRNTVLYSSKCKKIFITTSLVNTNEKLIFKFSKYSKAHISKNWNNCVLCSAMFGFNYLLDTANNHPLRGCWCWIVYLLFDYGAYLLSIILVWLIDLGRSFTLWEASFSRQDVSNYIIKLSISKQARGHATHFSVLDFGCDVIIWFRFLPP